MVPQFDTLSAENVSDERVNDSGGDLFLCTFGIIARCVASCVFNR